MAAFISSPFPYAAPLQALYCPMRLTASDQPSLVGVDEKIDTIGVTIALVANRRGARFARADRIAPLANLLFEKFDQRSALPTIPTGRRSI